MTDVFPRVRTRRALQLMRDRCTIKRPSVPQVDADGRETVTDVVVYEGRCKVQTYEPYESAPEVTGHTSVVQRYSVHVPLGTGSYEVGDIITITGSGRRFRVAGLHEKTLQTAIRLLVDEIVR